MSSSPQVLILAGGLGTRLGSLTKTTPKPLLPIFDKPFIEYQLEDLARQGVRDVVLSVGYLSEQFKALNLGRHFDRFQIVDEGQNLMGTGGAIRFAIDAVANHDQIQEASRRQNSAQAPLLSDDFIVIYGDSFLQVDYKKIWAHWKSLSHQIQMLMTVIENKNKWDVSNCIVEGGLVTLYDKRPEARTDKMIYIDYGLSVVRASTIKNAIPAHTKFDLATLQHTLSLQKALASYEVHDRFFEIGSPEGLDDFKKLIEQKTAEH